MQRRTEMVELLVEMEALEDVVLTVLERLRNGKIEDAIACFAEEFTFKDRGVDLEFKNKERLAEFFRKARELYPDSLLKTDAIFVSGDRVITEWTSSQCNEALLRRSLTNVSGFGARGLHRADRQWESRRLVGLLRRTYLPTLSLGFIFHGMGRTLNGAVRLGRWQRILSWPAHSLLTSY
jgi:hypothetical protein